MAAVPAVAPLPETLATIRPRELYRKRPTEEKQKATWYLDEEKTMSASPVETRIRSIRSVDETKIMFVNDSDVSVRALWIDFQGHEVAYSIIEPGTKKKYRTYDTHPWIVRDIQTGQQMMLNSRQVVYGGKEEQTVSIGRIPHLEWNLKSHAYFPDSFKQEVHATLLSHNRLERHAHLCLRCKTEPPSTPKAAASLTDRLYHYWYTVSASPFTCAQGSSTDTPAKTPPAAHVINEKQDVVLARPHLGDLPYDVVMQIIRMTSPGDVLQDLNKPEIAHPDMLPALLPERPPEATAAAEE